MVDPIALAGGRFEAVAIDDGDLAAVIASSRSERRAFNAAVETYRSENADLREADARMAVARIICSKP